jgi:enoyl-CoA hydratase
VDDGAVASDARLQGAGTVSLDLKQHTAVITIDHPPVNAFHPKVAADLGSALDRIEHSPAVRCVVLTATGRYFGAGGDVHYFQTLTPEEAQPYVLRIQAVQDRLQMLRQPVIAALNGSALGGGLELALACDIRVSDEGALLGLPEVTLGVIPAAGGTQRLPRLVGSGLARRLIFTGRPLSAAEALAAGLVDLVAPPGQALALALSLADTIAANSPLAVAAAKRAMLLGAETSVAAGQRIEATLFGTLVKGADFAEGVAAFLAKRPANFSR